MSHVTQKVPWCIWTMKHQVSLCISTVWLNPSHLAIGFYNKDLIRVTWMCSLVLGLCCWYMSYNMRKCTVYYGWHQAKTCLGICGHWRPWSDCASAESDQGLHCPLTKSLNTTECMSGEQRPGWDFAYMLDESESVCFVHVQRHLFPWCSPYISQWYHFQTVGFQSDLKSKHWQHWWVDCLWV